MVGQSGNRVLLVDDEPLFQKLISVCLVSARYVVQAAVDGLDAVKKLRAGLPDLIISDLNMPRMDGTELLEIIRKRFQQIPVMLVGDEALDALPGEVTADACFQKNRFGFHQLPEVISELTRRPHPRNAPPMVDDEPVQARRDGKGHYIINCGDCKREFSIPRIIHIGGAEKWTSCVHCGKMIQFLLAEQSEGK